MAARPYGLFTGAATRPGDPTRQIWYWIVVLMVLALIGAGVGVVRPLPVGRAVRDT